MKDFKNFIISTNLENDLEMSIKIVNKKNNNECIVYILLDDVITCFTFESAREIIQKNFDSILKIVINEMTLEFNEIKELTQNLLEY